MSTKWQSLSIECNKTLPCRVIFTHFLIFSLLHVMHWHSTSWQHATSTLPSCSEVKLRMNIVVLLPRFLYRNYDEFSTKWSGNSSLSLQSLPACLQPASTREISRVSKRREECMGGRKEEWMKIVKLIYSSCMDMICRYEDALLFLSNHMAIELIWLLSQHHHRLHEQVLEPCV